MKFVDSTTIYVKSGAGGPGAVSFRSAHNQPKLGADGGDGGFGGDIVLKGNRQLNTLHSLRYKQWYKAEDGHPGSTNNKTGRNGVSTVIEVPLGTEICDAESGELLGEITENKQELVVCKGGKRGIGNYRFLSSKKQTPRISTPGGPSESKQLQLELKIIADVGLAGFPNAGKSSFLRLVSDAKPKVADYPFTTLTPQVGVVKTDDLLGIGARPFVVADIPGLIKDAHKGKGLGIQFLKHLQRTSYILYIVDVSQALNEDYELDQEKIIQSFDEISHELHSFDEDLADKSKILAFNKCDLLDLQSSSGAMNHAAVLAQAAEKICQLGIEKVFNISAATGIGVDAMVKYIGETLMQKMIEEEKTQEEKELQQSYREHQRIDEVD